MSGAARKADEAAELRAARPGGAVDAAEAWGVYVHVPFCAARCAYCDFNTYSGMERYVGAYFRALRRELRAFWEERAYAADAASTPVADAAGSDFAYADTVFFGGGTPSFVDPVYLCDLLDLIPRAGGDGFACGGAGFTGAGGGEEGAWECTVEANPGTLDRDRLRAYREHGVNRLSLGLQSTHEKHLRMLGRIHGFDDFTRNLAAAREAGFENISADLMFGLPGQTVKEWEQTLETVVSLGLGHLSCYSLSLEEGTRLFDAVGRGELPAPDEDADREMYRFAAAYLRSAGILQYELSNFSAPGRECRHNLKYWTGARYRGFGAGAHSYDLAARFSNVTGIPEYIRAARRGASGKAAAQPNASVQIAAPQSASARCETIPIDAAEREKEFLILRLRLTRGFETGAFRAAFGRGFFEKYAAEAAELTAAGLLRVSPDGAAVSLTPKGMDLANQVFLKFI